MEALVYITFILLLPVILWAWDKYIEFVWRILE